MGQRSFAAATPHSGDGPRTAGRFAANSSSRSDAKTRGATGWYRSRPGVIGLGPALTASAIVLVFAFATPWGRRWLRWSVHRVETRDQPLVTAVFPALATLVGVLAFFASRPGPLTDALILEAALYSSLCFVLTYVGLKMPPDPAHAPPPEEQARDSSQDE